MKIVFEQLEEPSTYETFQSRNARIGRKPKDAYWVIEVDDFPCPLNNKSYLNGRVFSNTSHMKLLSGKCPSEEELEEGNWVVEDHRFERDDKEEIIQRCWVYFEG